MQVLAQLEEILNGFRFSWGDLEQYVQFDNCFFENWVYFDGAQFGSGVHFDRALFTGARFGEMAFFNGARFEGRTDFKNVKFLEDPADFHGKSELYSDTRFNLDQNAWPAPDSVHLNDYNRLRYLCNKAMLHDEEMFFSRQIMRCKELQDREEKKWPSFAVSRAYGSLSDYGTSYWWPLIWLLLSTLSFAQAYAYWEQGVTC